MNVVFADTSFYVALFGTRDSLRPAAVEFLQPFRGSILTTEYVMVELGNCLCRGGGRDAFTQLLHVLDADPAMTIVPSSSVLFHKGIDLFEKRKDKNWSVTDCISFVVMEENRLTDALTADHHFEQAGYRALLR